MFTRDKFAKVINEQGFLVKFSIVIGVTIGLLFVNNSYLSVYVQFSTFVSLIFLVYQSIALIDFGYIWSETWVEKYSNGATFYGILLILASMLLLTTNIAALFVNFTNFWLEGCYYNKLNLSFNVLFIIAVLVLVILKTKESSSVMTALFVCTIFTYNNGLSLSSYWVDTCNPFSKATDHQSFMYEAIFHVFINLFFGFLAVTSSSMTNGTSTSFQESGLKYKEPETGEESELERSINSVVDDRNIKDYLKREYRRSLIAYQTNYFLKFHFLMMIFSIYLVMIFFDWRKLNLDHDKWTELTSSNSSGFAVKTFNAGCIAFVYIWTLIAPMVYAEREFQ
jgi:Serine incorporator (Serinc)